MIKRIFKVTSLGFLLALFILLPLAGKAFFNYGQKNLFVAEDEIIDGDYIGLASNINVAGKVNGDVIVGGANVTITGDVAGDVIAAASSIKISGEVFGNVRVVGSNVEIASQVTRNLNAAGSTITITDRAKVGRNAYLAGTSIQISGPIAGELKASGRRVILANEIGKNVTVNLDGNGKLTLTKNAKIKGDLIYKAIKENQLNLQADATISGVTNYQPIVKYGAGYFFGKVFSLFGLLVVGLVLISIAPKIILETSEEMARRPAVSIGWGLVYLIVTPVLAFLLLFTIIGIPLSLIIIPLYIISLFLAKVIAGITIGLLILKRTPLQLNLLLAMILGLVVLIIITSLPLIGWTLNLLVILWALGAGLTIKKRMVAEWR